MVECARGTLRTQPSSKRKLHCWECKDTPASASPHLSRALGKDDGQLLAAQRAILGGQLLAAQPLPPSLIILLPTQQLRHHVSLEMNRLLRHLQMTCRSVEQTRT